MAIYDLEGGVTIEHTGRHVFTYRVEKVWTISLIFFSNCRDDFCENSQSEYSVDNFVEMVPLFYTDPVSVVSCRLRL